jgi:hypothetical protein
VEADSSDSMAEEYISVSEALKLVTPFSGNKKEVLTFISNVNTAFEVINPNHEDRLYKFVLTRISGEPSTAIAHRHLESWTELREFLRNTYIEKRTLDFHANQLFKARQGKSDSVSEWIQKIQTLGSKFREAALTHCTDEERAGILTLSDRLRNICFMQGLYSDRIQTIVRSRNHDDFDEIAETALEEESAIVSKLERYRGQDSSSVQCTICKKVGHISSKCFSKTKRENRVSQFSVKKKSQIREVICFACGEKGHFAKECKNSRRRRSGQENQRSETMGNGDGLSARSRQTVSTMQ